MCVVLQNQFCLALPTFPLCHVRVSIQATVINRFVSVPLSFPLSLVLARRHAMADNTGRVLVTLFGHLSDTYLRLHDTSRHSSDVTLSEPDIVTTFIVGTCRVRSFLTCFGFGDFSYVLP
jgi:hypothetical protein